MVDRDLIEAASRGDERAMSRLIAVCGPDLRRYARRSCDTEDIDESVQDALVILSRKVGSLRAVAGFSAWLFQVVRRACQRRWRRRDALRAPGDPAPDVAATLVDVDLRMDLSRIIAGLPGDLRGAIVLRDIQGLTAEEAGARLGITAEAVKSRLHRARLLIRKRLG